MTERAPGGPPANEQPSELMADEENTAAQISSQAEKEKSTGQAPETIAAVRSKIREKPSSLQNQQERDSLKLGKMSNTKLSRVSKRKQGKTKSSEALDANDAKMEESKTEPSETEQMDNSYAESKMTLNLSAVSKKSLATDVTSRSSRISSTEENRTMDELDSKGSGKRSVAEESLSTFVMSHDAEVPREEIPNPVQTPQAPQTAQNEDILSRRSIQKPVHERGNYLSNVSPAPIDDYKTENEDEEEKTEKKRL